MANAARLEVDIPFGGKTYTVKPTFEAITSIESATGMACITLASQFYSVRPDVEYAPLMRVAIVLHALLTATQKPPVPTLEEIGTTLMEDGMFDVLPKLGDFLSRALKGHKEHMKKAEETASGEHLTDPPNAS